jgi:hypothetical protein
MAGTGQRARCARCDRRVRVDSGDATTAALVAAGLVAAALVAAALVAGAFVGTDTAAGFPGASGDTGRV